MQPWPVALMLEELRLRSRRRLVGELRRRGVWPDRARYRRHAAGQRILGERLRDGALRAALGDTSFAILRSHTTFGHANRRMAARLPSVLAFGYELGAGLHRLSEDGDEPGAERAGTCCAVFNLGVAMFDVVYDTMPGASGRLTELVDERRLRELGTERTAASELMRDAGRLDEPELRLLAAVIAAFFTLLPATDRDGTLVELLERAYRAEIGSAPSASMTREEGHAAARAKSTLPFTIIGTVARGAVPGGDRDVQLDRLVEDVGVAFWLIDDLIDLVADYRAGALNALLSETCGPLGPDGYDGGADGLARLLDDGPPERAAGEAAGRLADAVAIAAAEGDPGDRLAGVLTCTARDWST